MGTAQQRPATPRNRLDTNGRFVREFDNSGTMLPSFRFVLECCCSRNEYVNGVSMFVNSLLSSLIPSRSLRKNSRRRLLSFAASCDALECRQLLAATNILPFGSVELPSSEDSTSFTLSEHFDDPAIEGSTVRIDSPLGSFIVETFDRITPITAQNFIDLATAGNYDDMFVHRSVPGFVIQGGGFNYPEGATSPGSVTNNGTIVNEFDNWFDAELGGLAAGTPLNLRGTVSMAKVGGNPDSATSQWFVSLADNSAILDPQNGGFTVFAQVLYDGMDTVDAIAALDRVNAGDPFSELPVRGEVGTAIVRDDLVTTTTTVVEKLAYEVTSNSNPGLLTASLVDGQLQIVPVTGQIGVAAVTVTATDLEGNTVSDTIEVTVGQFANIITPSGAAETQRPEFTWNEVPGATHYDLWVNQIGGQNAIINESGLTGTSFTDTSDLPSGSFTAWMRWHGSEGPGAWGQARNFSIDGLAAVQITSPTAGSTSNARPTFEWTAATDATSYDIWVNHVGVQNQIIRQDVTTNFFTPAEDLADGTYRVWVLAKADGQQSEWSSAITFEVGSGLTIIAPASTSTIARPEISWTGDANGTYELWVNAVGGASKVVHDIAVAGTSLTPTTDLADGRYRAWVREVPASGSPGAWSPAFDFYVAATGLPKKPTITDVTGTETALPTFSWAAVENGVTFELWVNDLTSGTTRVIHKTSLTELTFTATNELASGNYRVWLRAFSSAVIAGPWSDPFDFTI